MSAPTRCTEGSSARCAGFDWDVGLLTPVARQDGLDSRRLVQQLKPQPTKQAASAELQPSAVFPPPEADAYLSECQPPIECLGRVDLLSV